MSDTKMQAISDPTDNNHHQLSSKQNKQQLVILNVDAPNINNSLHGEISQIQNFYKMDIKEIGPTTQDINETIFEEDLSIIIDELVDLNFEGLNKGKEKDVRNQNIFDYINNHKIMLQEIYIWLMNNQTSSNSIYLLGYFNYQGLGTNINKKNAFELYQKTAKLENIVAQYCLAYTYINGEGTNKNY